VQGGFIIKGCSLFKIGRRPKEDELKYTGLIYGGFEVGVGFMTVPNTQWRMVESR
jgi:hypothetical protein